METSIFTKVHNKNQAVSAGKYSNPINPTVDGNFWVPFFSGASNGGFPPGFHTPPLCPAAPAAPAVGGPPVGLGGPGNLAALNKKVGSRKKHNGWERVMFGGNLFAQ